MRISAEKIDVSFDKYFSRALLAVLLFLAVVHLLTLRAFPIMRIVDEPEILLMAHTFPDTHNLDRPPSFGWAPIHAREPRAYLVTIAWVYVFGMDWVAARFLTLCVGIATLLVTFHTARKMYGYQAGLIAACFMAASSMFFITAHHIRLDIFLAFMIAVVILVHNKAREENSRFWHFMTGFLLVLSYEGHPNAVVFLFSFGVYYFVYCVRALIRKEWDNAWIALLGVMVGSILWVLIHVLPSIHDFQRSLEFTKDYRPFPITQTLSVSQLYDQYKEAGLSHYYSDTPLEVLLGIVIIGCGLTFKRTNLLATLYILSHIGAMLIINPFRPVYFVNTLPLLALVAGGLLTAFDSRQYRLSFTVPILAVLVGSTLHQVVPVVKEDWNNRIIDKLATLQSVIPDGAVVFGNNILLLGLGSHTRVIDAGLTAVMRHEGKTLEEGMDLIRPDFIVYGIQETPPHHLSEYWGMEMWHTHLDNQHPYVQSNYELILSEPGVYGKIEVYKRRVSTQ